MPDLRQLTNQRLSLQFILKGASPQSIKEDYNSFLKNIQELYLCQYDNIIQLIDEGRVDYFQHLQLLSIRASMTLKHVNDLGSIPSLYIWYCYNLHDISALGRNRYVGLEHCLAIQDISALATVPIVDIHYCRNVKDYTCLSKV